MNRETRAMPEHHKLGRSRRFLRRLDRNERGATVVEAALVTLPFITIIFMIMEFGPMFFEWSSGKNAASEGVRLESIVGDGDNADYDTIRSMRNSLKNLGDKLDYVIVYKAKNLRDKVPTVCTALATSRQPDVDTDPVGLFVSDPGLTVENYPWGAPSAPPIQTACNVYYPRMFSLPNIPNWKYDRDKAIAPVPVFSLDRFWPGRYRVAYLSGPQDFVGVYVQSSHRSITGLFPQLGTDAKPRIIRNTGIVRIEPSRATK